MRKALPALFVIAVANYSYQVSNLSAEPNFHPDVSYKNLSSKFSGTLNVENQKDGQERFFLTTSDGKYYLSIPRRLLNCARRIRNSKTVEVRGTIEGHELLVSNLVHSRT